MDSVTSQPNANTQTRRQTRSAALSDAVGRVEATLPSAGQSVTQAVLVVFCGLPGSGKSYLARRVQPRLPATIVETDYVRRVLFPQPRYTGPESAWVYAVCHALIARLLSHSQSVVFDATNLLERSRQSLHRIAERTQVKMLIVRTVAPDEVIRQRLLIRNGQADPDNHSDAGVEVYEKLRPTEQPICSQHVLIDTTQDCAESVQLILRECGLV